MKKSLGKFTAKLAKSLPLIAICVTVVGLSYWTLFSHYRGFSFIGGNDLIYRVESKLLDLRFKMRGVQKPTGKIGILAIDEKAVAMGGWPLDRKYYAQAFANLKKHGVKWIGFDAIYAEPSRAYLTDAAARLEELSRLPKAQVGEALTGELADLRKMLKHSPSDMTMASGIQNFGQIVLGYFFFGSKEEAELNLGDTERFRGLETMLGSAIEGFDMPGDKTLDSYPQLRKAYGLVPNIPLIADSSPHFAFFSNDPDDDAINRWVLLVANIDGHLMPSLSLKTIAEALGREIFVFFDDVGIEHIVLVNREDETDTIEIPVDPLGTGRVLINHRGPGRTFRHFSLADAYHDNFTKEELGMLKGMTLLLGGTATGTNDMRANPFDPSIDGVENHAAIMDNIVRRDLLKRPISIYATELLIVLGVGLLFSPLMIFGRAFVSGLAVVLFLIGYYYVDKYFWFGRGIWAYMAVPCLEIVGLFVTTTLYKYMTEEREKKKVKGAFQHYLSPEVIDQVLDDPDSLKLGGQKKELTVFFSDVRGFTTISESLTPEKLCELMNDYFTPMTSIILRSGGVLDKYIGDAIMAFWGAPIEMADAADRAAESSILMLYAMDKLREDFARKGFPTIDIGIGLNTGPMAVGNMGSGERFCYTVMGDSVNLGSRLEGLTKEYGIKIMLSEFTHAKLTPGKFFTRDLDDIRVKGKNEPVRVYDLMRPDFLATHDAIREFAGHFNAGRAAYKQQCWDEARNEFLECMKIKPDDKATAKYLDRVDEFKAASPGVDWDGVYTFTHK